jgi:hypothetical protein
MRLFDDDDDGDGDGDDMCRRSNPNEMKVIRGELSRSKQDELK